MMNIDDVRGKRVTVFGLGLNQGGVGTVRFLSEAGARDIIVTDMKTEEELAPSIAALQDVSNVRYVLGHHDVRDFTDTDMVVKTPGVPWTNEYVRAALEANVPVEVDASLFFRLCPCPIVGVTGTKGKTTTSVLLAALLRGTGKHVVEVGIGQTPVLGRLHDITSDSVVVFELSSWRLSGLRAARMSPHIAVFTNFFPDHMNYYASLEEYFLDKKSIFEFQKPEDWVVYNADTEMLCASVADVSSRKMSFSIAGEQADLFVRDGAIVSRHNGIEEPVVRFEAMKLRGKHNIGNVLAALGGALAYGASLETCVRILREFSGVPHRLECVAERDGIAFYNDTAATVPEAAAAALEAFDEPVILIAGGADKNLDFGVLAQAIATRQPKALICFRGAATDKLLAALRETWPKGRVFPEIPVVGSMAEAVALAQKAAVPGDVVLLSPGAASFGIFQNEFDRGDQFRNQVQEITG